VSARHRIVIAGGGVAALEALLALHALAPEPAALDITLLAPEPALEYRPLATSEPFGLGDVRRFDLAAIAAEHDAHLRVNALAHVDPDAGVVQTGEGDILPYDALLVATGAVLEATLPGALTFGGPQDTAALAALLDELGGGEVSDLVFAVPGGIAWSLPAYELALLTAARLAGRGVEDVRIALVTPEPAPLYLFGPQAGDAIGALLADRGIDLRAGTYPDRIVGDRLHVIPEGTLAAQRVVALPRLAGPRIPGLHHDPEGFLPTDRHARVRGASRVYAAGDVTSFAVKQGGIATQEADAAAEAILADLGEREDPTPFRPVLRGLLLTGAVPRFLRAEISGGRGEAEAETTALWWPPSKIVGHWLAPYLASRAGESNMAPPVGPGALLVEAALDHVPDARSPG